MLVAGGPSQCGVPGRHGSAGTAGRTAGYQPRCTHRLLRWIPYPELCHSGPSAAALCRHRADRLSHAVEITNLTRSWCLIRRRRRDGDGGRPPQRGRERPGGRQPQVLGPACLWRGRGRRTCLCAQQPHLAAAQVRHTCCSSLLLFPCPHSALVVGSTDTGCGHCTACGVFFGLGSIIAWGLPFSRGRAPHFRCPERNLRGAVHV